MFLKDIFFFLFDVALLLLDFLLLLDDAEELISFLLGLLGKALLALEELSLAGVFHVTEDLLLVLKVPSLLIASLALAFLEGTLGTESIDFSLSISGLLLEFSKASYLAFLLFLDALQVSCFLFLALSLVAVVVNNLLLEVLLFSFTLVLDINGPLVGLLDLAHHSECAVLLDEHLPLLLLLDLLSLAYHLLHFALPHLLLLNTL